jgi:hypothetical protein
MKLYFQRLACHCYLVHSSDPTQDVFNANMPVICHPNATLNVQQ